MLHEKSRQNKEYMAKLLMQSNSLHDLFLILQSICETLKLTRMNPKIKYFRYFQFTFFGLMVKSKGLLDMIGFKTEFLRKTTPEFEEIYAKLVNLQKKMNYAYALIHSDKVIEGKKEIISCSKEYHDIFENINKISMKIILC